MYFVERCYTLGRMAARKLAAFRFDDDLLEGLQMVWDRDGVQPSEQVRRAVRQWLEGKGVLKPHPRRTVHHSGRARTTK
jgi:hypothetical protein